MPNPCLSWTACSWGGGRIQRRTKVADPEFSTGPDPGRGTPVPARRSPRARGLAQIKPREMNFAWFLPVRFIYGYHQAVVTVLSAIIGVKFIPPCGAADLASHARCLDRQALCAPGEVELEVEIFLRAVRQHLGAYSGEAGAQPALERTHRLPFHAIGRVGVGMALADGLGEQALAPLRVVAVRAREVHLSAPQMIGRATRLEMRASRALDARLDRQAERLARDVGGEREQLLGLVTQG